MMHPSILRFLKASLVLAVGFPAQAIILHKSATRNTTAPGGAYLNSGWNYQLPNRGIPIGPKTFLAANHTGVGVGNVFSWNGVTYQVTAKSLVSGTDIAICTVNNNFTSVAPLYNPSVDGSLNNKTMVLFGRGKQRGAELHLSSAPRAGESTLRGWEWGAADNVLSWGTNTVDSLETYPVFGNMMLFDFDASGTSDEATVAAGDSGGGVFVQGANGVWKFAGLIYGVQKDYRLTAGGTDKEAAVFDKGNLYHYDNGWQFATDLPSNIPGIGFVSNVSNYLASFTSALPKTGDATLDGKVNTLDFNVLAGNFGMSSAGQWNKGDFNADGIVNSVDFNAMMGNYGFGASAAPLLASHVPSPLGAMAPEPAGLAVLGISLALFGVRRRSPAGV